MRAALLLVIVLSTTACGEAGVVFHVMGALRGAAPSCEQPTGDCPITSIEMTVVASAADGAQCKSSWSVGAGTLPYDFAVVRGEQYDAAVSIDVRALSGQEVHLRRVAWVAFEDDLIEETISLEPSCLDATCDEGEQCGGGVCEPIAPQALGEWLGLPDCDS